MNSIYSILFLHREIDELQVVKEDYAKIRQLSFN